jgi:hypothetical protein
MVLTVLSGRFGFASVSTVKMMIFSSQLGVVGSKLVGRVFVGMVLLWFAGCSPKEKVGNDQSEEVIGVAALPPSTVGEPRAGMLGAVVGVREFGEKSADRLGELQKWVRRFWAEPEARDEILDLLEADYYTADLLPFLRDLIDSGDSDLAQRAVELLRGNTSSEILPVLSRCLESAEEDLRVDAVLAAGGVRGPELKVFLERAFADSSPSVRMAYLFDMEHHSDVQKLRITETALAAPHQDVRSLAVGELELMSNPRSLELLMKSLDSPHEDLREEAAFSIEFLVGETFSSASEAEAWWRIHRRRFNSELVEIELIDD